MRELGPDSVVVIGGEDGRPRAFLNVCRHRGARIVEEAEGRSASACAARTTPGPTASTGSCARRRTWTGVEDFEPLLLRPASAVRLAVVGGLVLIDLSGDAPERRRARRRPARPPRALPARRRSSAPASAVYEVAANWKGIAENYNECLHCPGVHPELNALSDYMSGDEVIGEGAWCGGSMTLREGATTMAFDERQGHAAGPPADRRASPTRTSTRSSTSRCSRTRSSRCTPTT